MRRGKGLKPVEITFEAGSYWNTWQQKCIMVWDLSGQKAPILYQCWLNTHIAHKHGILNFFTANVILHQFYFFFLDFPSETSKSGRASCHLIGLDLHRFESNIQRQAMLMNQLTNPGGMVTGNWQWPAKDQYANYGSKVKLTKVDHDLWFMNQPVDAPRRYGQQTGQHKPSPKDVHLR